MVPMKFSTFEADAKSWVNIIVFLVEFLHGYELSVCIFKVFSRKQCSKVDGTYETPHLENDLKAMQNDLGLSHNLRKK